MIIGLVGKPSCGKSTFFKSATLAEVDIADYPFTTINPSEAVGFVRIKDVSEEFSVEAEPRTGFVKKGFRFVPVNLLDVAGLVPNAYKGEGMGSQFLSDLNKADALIHIVDVSGSTNQKGEKVPPSTHDPAEDVRFLEEELDHWFRKVLKENWERLVKKVRTGGDPTKILAEQFSGMGADKEMVREVFKKHSLEKELSSWSESDRSLFSRELRIKTKPMMIAANKIDVDGAEKNLERLKEEFPEYKIVGCSAESELALREASEKGLIEYVPGGEEYNVTEESGRGLNEEQRRGLEFIKQEVLSKNNGTGVQEVLNTAVFSLLDYIAVHPVASSKLEDKDGRVLPDCFLLSDDTTPLELAYTLHSDIGDSFSKAIDRRTDKPVGKDSVLNHLDVIEIMTE